MLTQEAKQTQATSRGNLGWWLLGSLLCLVAISLVAISLVAIGLGSVWIPPAQVVEVIANKAFGCHYKALLVTSMIVWNLRVPRVVAAAIVGAMLAVAGTALQGLVRNPLADP